MEEAFQEKGLKERCSSSTTLRTPWRSFRNSWPLRL